MDFRVLGPLEVEDDGRQVALGGPKPRALLAILLLQRGEVVHAERLIELLYDGLPPEKAPNSVYAHVSRLRKALSGGRLRTAGRGYVLDVLPGELDLDRFEELVASGRKELAAGEPTKAARSFRQALALWRGPPFADFRYSDFAQAPIARLEERRLVAMEDRIDADLALGQHADLVSELESFVTEFPLRERPRAQLMLALYRSGRQAEALAAFDKGRRLHVEEFGIEPSTELRKLQRAILTQDAALALPVVVSTPEHQRSRSLPAPANRLIGRKDDLRAIKNLLLGDARLVTVTGAGGSGKTRLALEVAMALEAEFGQSVCFVRLAPLRQSDLLAVTILSTLGITEVPDEEPLDFLARTVSGESLLLVLDNFEHLLASALLISELLANCPRLKVLVTSRAALHLSGEHEYSLEPLPIRPALALFTERAKAVRRDFAAEETVLAAICTRLDCLPLALELAAARCRVLSPAELLGRLGRSLEVLTDGPRDLAARQQTLRATIDWSYSLLDRNEQQIFVRVAVFAAGCTLEAAERVCAASLEQLESLVDKNLLRARGSGSESWFWMLETIREFALERLGDERAQIELALALYFAQLVEELRLSEGLEPEWRKAIERLEPEIQNVRVALAAAAASGDRAFQVQLAGGLWRYWHVRGPAAEGLEWIEQALAGEEGPATIHRARALYGGAVLSWDRGDLERAKELAQIALSVAVDAGSEWYELGAHTVRGAIASDEGDYATARSHHQRSLEIKEQLGLDPAVEKLNLGEVASRLGEHESAIALFEEVLASFQRSASVGSMGVAHLNLGLVRHELGDYGASQRDFEQARTCLESVGFRQQAAYALQGLAACEASGSHFEEAARLLGEARRELDEIGLPSDAFAPDMIASIESKARAALGDEGFEAASSRRPSELAMPAGQGASS